MRLTLGRVPDSEFLNLPKLLIRLSRPQRSDRVFIVGRLYRGYVGAMWSNWLFELDVWIYNME